MAVSKCTKPTGLMYGGPERRAPECGGPERGEPEPREPYGRGPDQSRGCRVHLPRKG